MTTDAKVIRAGRYSEIGAVIRRDAAAVIGRWAARAAEEQPAAARVHHDALIDDLPAFLDALGAALEEAVDPDGSRRRGPAARHGEQRWEDGWSLPEVVRDYRILRLVLLEHLDGALARPLRLRESQAVGLSLDEAVEASVAHYVRERDAAARSQAESLARQADALREADRRKNEFLATLAHELRNPLAPLRNCIEAFRLGDDTAEAARQTREVMDRQVRQMTRLVEDLLDVSRIAQGKLVLRKAPTDLRAALEQAVQTSEPLLRNRRHGLSVSLPPEPLWVDGDQSRLVQVFVNLLNNAAKYTPEGGNVALTAAREGQDVAVRVKDDGKGVPADMLPLIFEMFTQLDAGPERPEGGLGIGLTLVRRLVELHGGAIMAASDGPGRGSEFTVRLPTAAEAPARSEPSEVGRPSAARRVLIVEDNRDGRDTLARLLGLMGHRVEVAEDGERGVEAALGSRPEVCLIDIGLPGLDGYEVARRLRAGLGGQVLLVAMTGYSQPEEVRRAAEAGFDAHLPKPVELDDLVALLARAAG